jgi:hypothetical protein
MNMPRTSFWKPSKLLAERQFGAISLRRFGASARWRASAGAHRRMELAALSHEPSCLDLTLDTIFGAGEGFPNNQADWTNDRLPVRHSRCPSGVTR